MDLNLSTIAISNGSHEIETISDVLFGSIRPALTSDIESDRVELPLPSASITDCVWTTNGTLFSVSLHN